MEGIFILGAGGLAKEVYAHIKQMGGRRILGFVDVIPRENIIIGRDSVPVVVEEELESYRDKASLAMGVGDPKLLEKLSGKFAKDFAFPNLIHPTVSGNFDDIVLGKGNIITTHCTLTTSITIGSFNIFNPHCAIGHDVVIGDCNVFNPSVNISGGVVIGASNLIGVKATVLQYKTIGNHSVVGASSLVTRDVPDGVTVVGIPAVLFNK